VRYVAWPADKKQIDIGSFYTDSSKFEQTTGWTPEVALADGFARTITFYREHLPRYVEAG
jgi:nucleoside-diphosphate-sugar epimerase